MEVGGAIAAGLKVEISTLDNDPCDKVQLVLERLGQCHKFITTSHQDRPIFSKEWIAHLHHAFAVNAFFSRFEHKMVTVECMDL
jgi:hypothetical protein